MGPSALSAALAQGFSQGGEDWGCPRLREGWEVGPRLSPQSRPPTPCPQVAQRSPPPRLDPVLRNFTFEKMNSSSRKETGDSE